MADASMQTLRNKLGNVSGYRVRWRAGGQRRSKSFSKEEKPCAKRYLDDVRAAQTNKKRKPRPRRQIGGASLEEFFEKHYTETRIELSRKKHKRLSPSTIDMRERIWNTWVKPYLGNKPIKSITPADIEAFYNKITLNGRDENGYFLVDAQGDTIRPNGSWKDGIEIARKSRALLRDVFFYAVREHIVQVDPTREAFFGLPHDEDGDQNNNGTRANFTDEEVERLLTSAPFPFRLPLRLLATIGLRIGEMAALTVGDFNEKLGQLTITKSLSTKPKRLQNGLSVVSRTTKTSAGRRKINLPKDLAVEIANHCKGKESDEPMFTTVKGAIIRPDNFRSRVWRPLRDSLEFHPSLTPHALRHYVATRLLADGIDEQAVCDMLGHQHVGITNMLYRHARPENRRTIAEYWERSENHID